MHKFCDIVIDNKSRNTDRVYTYEISSKDFNKIGIGKRVIISFNNSITIGLIISIRENIDFDMDKIKTVISFIDDEEIISSSNVKLGFWIRSNYLSRYNEAFSLMINSISKIEVFIEFCGDIYPEYLNKDFLNKWISYKLFLKEFGQKNNLNKLYESIDSMDINIISKDSNFDEKKYEIVELIEFDYIKKIKKNASNQLMILDYLSKNNRIELNKLINKVKTTKKSIKLLEDKNLIKIYQKDTPGKYNNRIINSSELLLTDEQVNIINEIIVSKKNKFLIHGVTGSGKTEVYMKIIEEYLINNKSIIYLVPEISLTPQTIDRFKTRFGDRIAVIHSRLTTVQKNAEWIKIFKQEVDIVIGARSALFSPLKNLGLIIIDEAHETSYKSSTSPKYDTIEVSEKIAELNNIKLILGTATPSAETYLKAIRKEFVLLNLTKRVNNIEMPEINVIDMRTELDEGNKSVFSKDLINALIDAYNNEEQSILFLNRRGYSSFVSCRNCGYVVKCDNCDVSMTYHSKKDLLICHYCGKTKKLTKSCPECGSKYFKSFGIGTQKVEEEVSKLIPKARVKRMDFDTTSIKGEFDKIYNDFKDKKIDILVGTQMLAKGLHFPDVTVVGIISADMTINLPFYTANERSYQLITQVSGRAGRGDKKGKVFVQTYDPDSYSIVYSKNNDYISYVKKELFLRKEFRYPPYINILSITFASKNEKVLKEFVGIKAIEISDNIKKFVDERKMILYPPMNNNIYKVNNKFRISILIKCNKNIFQEIKEILRKILLNRSYKEIDISLDINPTSI